MWSFYLFSYHINSLSETSYNFVDSTYFMMFWYSGFLLIISLQLPTKNQLLKMIENAGGMEGDLMVLGIRNIKRAKRLMGLDLVRENNIIASSNK